jgi:hypothetical protein
VNREEAKKVPLQGKRKIRLFLAHFVFGLPFFASSYLCGKKSLFHKSEGLCQGRM